MSEEYYFNQKTQRYHHRSGSLKGKMVSGATVTQSRENFISESTNNLLALTKQLTTEKKSLKEWEEQASQILTRQHAISYLLGIGGEKNLEDSDIEAINNRVKSELIYLRRLSNDYEKGLVSDSQLNARIKMFTRSSRGTYEGAKQTSHKKNGFLWEQRILTKTENCNQCYEYSLRGWQRIGVLPPPTVACNCRSNCGCYKIYSNQLFPEDAAQPP
jgi:hypothetical protein